MYTSKNYLHKSLGLDFEIAAFFVDRKIPKDNAYWKGRYLYVAAGTGYLFIPLFFDLQFKLGVAKDKLLGEDYVTICEAILHSAALHEFEEISFDQHIENCHELLKGSVVNASLYQTLSVYFSNKDLQPYKNIGTFSKALNRGDSFLFALCTLDIPGEISDLIVKQWYALVPSFLLLDDISDFQEDRETGSENSISDFGTGVQAVERALQFMEEKIDIMKQVNVLLGVFFEESLTRNINSPYIQSILKA